MSCHPSPIRTVTVGSLPGNPPSPWLAPGRGLAGRTPSARTDHRSGIAPNPEGGICEDVPDSIPRASARAVTRTPGKAARHALHGPIGIASVGVERVGDVGEAVEQTPRSAGTAPGRWHTARRSARRCAARGSRRVVMRTMARIAVGRPRARRCPPPPGCRRPARPCPGPRGRPPGTSRMSARIWATGRSRSVAPDITRRSRWMPCCADGFGHMAQCEATRLEHGPREVPPTVGERQPREHAARAVVVDGRPLPREIGQEHQARRARRGATSPPEQRVRGHHRRPGPGAQRSSPPTCRWRSWPRRTATGPAGRRAPGRCPGCPAPGPSTRPGRRTCRRCRPRHRGRPDPRHGSWPARHCHRRRPACRRGCPAPRTDPGSVDADLRRPFHGTPEPGRVRATGTQRGIGGMAGDRRHGADGLSRQTQGEPVPGRQERDAARVPARVMTRQPALVGQRAQLPCRHADGGAQPWRPRRGSRVSSHVSGLPSGLPGPSTATVVGPWPTTADAQQPRSRQRHHMRRARRGPRCTVAAPPVVGILLRGARARRQGRDSGSDRGPAAARRDRRTPP